MSEVKLTIEQEFEVRAFRERIQQLSREQAIELLGEQFALWVAKEAMYKELLKQEWHGMGNLLE
jgi:hypothetical protein